MESECAVSSGEHTRAYVAVAVAMVAISFASIFIKWSLSPPFVLAFYRLAFATMILFPFLVWTRGFSEIRSFGRREVALVVMSAVALSFHFGLWIISLSLTLVSTSVILVTSHPLFVAGISHFLMNERVQRVALIGIMVAFSGVCVIAVADYQRGHETLLGDVLAFLGGICAGIYFLSGRIARQKMSLGPYVFSVYSLSCLILLAAALVVGDQVLVLDSRELTIFLLLALIPTIFGHTMFNYALRRLPAHIVSTSVLGEPVGASLLAYAFLPDEVPGPWIILGGVLVIGGLYVVLLRSRPRRSPPERESPPGNKY